MFTPATHWRRLGLVLSRPHSGTHNDVAGDPSIVWDPEINNWRMVLFYSPPGHGQAVCTGQHPVTGLPDQWRFDGPLQFTNPAALSPGEHPHKPYIVTDAYRPNIAANVDGKYWLLCVPFRRGHKFVQRAWSVSLAGPWTWEEGALIPPGAEQDWDGKHTDAVSGIYFPDRREFVYFYMGYPQVAQANRPHSPWGSAQGVAVQSADGGPARKLGIILPPAAQPGHWAGGYVGGLQVLPGKDHRWIALANASPTPPQLDSDRSISREEPPPSLGGFAWTDAEYPTSGWHWFDQPLEWIEQVPADAIANGEGVNLWRHHLLQLQDGRNLIYYNSGSYGQEQLFAKLGE